MIMIDINVEICDLDGTPIPLDGNPDSGAWRLGHVLIRTVLQGPMAGAKPYTADQQMVRYNLAKDIRDALMEEPHTIEIANMVALKELREEIARNFPPAIAGPALIAMVPWSPPPADKK